MEKSPQHKPFKIKKSYVNRENAKYLKILKQVKRRKPNIKAQAFYTLQKTVQNNTKENYVLEPGRKQGFLPPPTTTTPGKHFKKHTGKLEMIF